MSSFSSLPIELLDPVLQHILRPAQLAQICLVNSAFYSFTVPVLYRRAFIYAWHKDSKLKVVKLFETLAGHPELAKYVEQLSIRDFPRAISPGERDAIWTVCLRGLQNCINLKAFLWTRDGSLSTTILQTLQQLPQLSELEINGHSEGYYDPTVLLSFTRLRKITLILPGSRIMDLLPTWAARTGETLRHLTMIWESTTLLTDNVLETLSQHLTQLESLYLVGCPKVTHKGLWSILSANGDSLRGLGMETLSSSFDMASFAQLCKDSKALRSLRAINLNIDTRASSQAWSQQVIDLLSSSALETFHISSLAGEAAIDLPDSFIHDIVSTHFRTLRRFSVNRMRVSLSAIKDICARCTYLERLFIVLQHENLDELGSCLSMAANLRAFHATRSLGLESEEALVIPEHRILSLVRQCSWKLTQIGFYTRVKQVDRVTYTDDDGVIRVDSRLVPYENPEMPEPFLIVRT